MKQVLLIITAFFLILIVACSKSSPPSVTFDETVNTVEELAAHSKEFDTPEVIEVVPGIHVAIGFGLANSILIEGKNGNIIVDCMESNETATKVKEAFNKISEKPIKAIIYTHNHTDHIFGAGVMAGEDQPDIYSHELTNYYIDRLVSVVLPAIEKRSYRMFGTQIDENSHINCGIGPRLDAQEGTTRSLLRPTTTFKDSLEVEIEGLTLKMAHVPGETDDQLYVWLPEKKVLLSGDNIYKTFPNLYTIRGTPYRDVKAWAHSLDKMRYLKAEVLIPSHTRPIKGAAQIEEVLRDYADGVRFVHDQTIRFMNEGLTPDEIVEKVKLPPHLSKSPYLQEFYGRVDWSVRNVFNGYMGWFGGNSTTLIPLKLQEKAENMAALAGGKEQLQEKAETALKDKAYQWALELSDYLLQIDKENGTAQNIRYESLIGLGEQQSNPNARNYYLSQALEIKGQEIVPSIDRPLSVVHSIPLASIFSALAVHLKAEKCLDYDKKTVFKFTDMQEEWSVHVRRGVAEIQPFALEEPDLTVETTRIIWNEIAAEVRSPVVAIAKGDLKIEGGLGNFNEFMSLFRD